MNRCKICDQEYEVEKASRFQEEGYCPVCDAEISMCLEELEPFEEVEDEADIY